MTTTEPDDTVRAGVGPGASPNGNPEPYTPPGASPSGNPEPYTPPGNASAPTGNPEPYSPPVNVAPNGNSEPYSPPQPVNFGPPQPYPVQPGGSGAWVHGRTIEQLWSSSDRPGVLVFVAGLGWKRFAGAEGGRSPLVALAVLAKANGLPVSFHEDGYGQIDQLLV